MNTAEIQAFEANPYASIAIELRHWNDLVKDTTKTTPSLHDLRPMLEQCLRR